MGILTFKGGVHPYDGKELSKNSPVVKYLPKGDMVYPLSQHIGAPAAAIVQKGDHVLAGQKIADAAGFVSSPIHSSVSGTVKGIEPRLTATGSMVNSIIIENDQQYESVEFTPARLEGDATEIAQQIFRKRRFWRELKKAELWEWVAPDSPHR